VTDPSENVKAVFKANGKLVLGREYILDIDHHQSRLQCNCATSRVVRLQAARHKAASVHVHEEGKRIVTFGRGAVASQDNGNVIAHRYTEFLDVEALLRDDGIVGSSHSTSFGSWG
jgi:hypothetical protein